MLGDTAQGLTGREIGQLLAAVKVPDVEGANKRDRLAGALLAQQERQQASNCVIAFITAAMAPVRYAQQPHAFSHRQDDLNEVLVHVGLRVNDEGRLARGPAAARLPGTPVRCGPSCAGAPRIRRCCATAPWRSWPRTPSTPV
ncbi:hypothetical protein [Streptomyces sp. NPDC059092]|uniref:hypothetical protein n=1 Tax=Streptomyces sp. NPDC059092 TaxID=3346725 RepID=UPI0036859BCB